MPTVSNKEHRQDAILRLVGSQTIATQAQLRELLAGAGHDVNQPTLSRDLAELHVHKRGGRYVQETPLPPATADEHDFAAAVREFLPCGPHLIVVRTMVGQAQPVALAIDRAKDAAIVATLAGDDSVFVATKTRRTQAVALRRFKEWFGEKNGR